MFYCLFRALELREQPELLDRSANNPINFDGLFIQMFEHIYMHSGSIVNIITFETASRTHIAAGCFKCIRRHE